MKRRHALLSLLAPLATGTAPAARPVRTAAGWQRAVLPPGLGFPADHHAHPDFRTEWWYFTGHLRSAEGREFGFQLTFFRFGLRPPDQEKAGSAFLVDQLPMAHFAISDPPNGRIHTCGRLERGAFGRAGFPSPDEDGSRLVWIGDWLLELTDEGGFRAVAEDNNQALELELMPPEQERAWVLHGEGGLSRKAPGGRHNSIYYSCPRMTAKGRLRLDRDEFPVEGEAWMDREWSSGLLDESISGWDWFSLNLRDGRDLMLFQLRDREGNRLRGGHGTLVEADGQARNLTAPEFILTPLDWWQSPESGARYPVRWNVELPNERLQIFVDARFPEQEIVLPPTIYWEGMVRARGQAPGRGYLEMTGYGENDATLAGLRGA